MKIAQIVCTFPPYRGGIGNSVYNISAGLSDLGHEVTVFTPSYNYKEETGFHQHEGVFKLKRLRPLYKLGNAAIVPQLFFKLRDFDIVHFHYPFYGAAIPVLFMKLVFGSNVKLILHYHMDNRGRGFKSAIFYLYNILILPLLARVAEIITCASLDYIKHSNLKKYYKLKPDKFRKIFFGVALEKFITYHDNKNKERKNKVILFVGGLDKAHYFKGLDNLLNAMAEIIKEPKLNSTILKIIGHGDLADHYKKYALDLGLKKNVEFYESIDNNKLIDFYNYSDCLVLPSINNAEAFGLVLLEAMSCSLPVIASNLPGVRSVFKNGREGLLIKPGCINDLIDKIKIVLNDEKFARAMGSAGRKLVKNKYTWGKVSKRLDAIYNYVQYRPKI